MQWSHELRAVALCTIAFAVGLATVAFAGALRDLEIRGETQLNGEERDVRPNEVSRLPCEDIIHAVDQEVQPADPGRMGRLLGQNAAWVERCMTTYGRRIAKPASVDLEAPEDVSELWESAEPDETGDEEIGDAQIRPKRVRTRRSIKTPTPEIPSQ